jgi:hypothetical protein
MPRDPEGRKRPADVIGNAVHVMRIATGQTEEKTIIDSAKARGGKAGGPGRLVRYGRGSVSTTIHNFRFSAPITTMSAAMVAGNKGV